MDCPITVNLTHREQSFPRNDLALSGRYLSPSHLFIAGADSHDNNDMVLNVKEKL